MKNKEKILHAVVKSVKGIMVFGKSHADCFHAGGIMGLDMSQKVDDQGFFTNTGKYVDRKEAATIAKRAKQLNRKNMRNKHYHILFSEDIWYQKDRFEYNQLRGYFEVK